MKNYSRFVFLFVLLNIVLYQTAHAQQIIINNGGLQIINNGTVENAGPDNNLIHAPRETIQRLKTALALMKDKRYSESVRILWDILKNEEDAFINVNFESMPEEEKTENPEEQPNENPNTVNPQAQQNQPAPGPKSMISLKTYIQNLLAQAPEEVRKASELIVGTEAQNALDEAVQSGNLDRLLEVSRDYFSTEAGFKASFLSGLLLLNDGQAASAVSIFDSMAGIPGVRQKFEPAFSVLWLNSLILSGQDVNRRELVTQLRQRLARVDWTVENKQMTGFDNREQLEKYLAIFAEKAQKSDCQYPSAEPFTLPRWTVPTYTNPTLEAVVQSYLENELKSTSSSSNQYNASMCSFEPTVSGHVVFSRTLFGLTAVDIQTGKRLWDSSGDFSAEIQKRWDCNGEYERKAIAQFLYYTVIFRTKYDFTYGALRSDEKYVYAIEDIWKDRIQQGVLTPRTTSGLVISRSATASFTQNRLAAYDIKTGKLKWHVGSATVNYGSGADSSLNSTTFLGAPLIMNGKLYIIGETPDSMVVFYELDSANGKVLWSQTLGDSQNSLRDRTYNLTPAYLNGMIVCPLSSSTLVCLDLRQRRLLWGFNAPSTQKVRFGVWGSGSSDLKNELDRMEYSYNNYPYPQKGYQLSLMDSKAFFTPVRSSETYVINLADGSLDEQLTSLKSQNWYIPLSVDSNKIVYMTMSDIRIWDFAQYNQKSKEMEQVQALRHEKEQQLSKVSPEERQKVTEEFVKISNDLAQLEKERKATLKIFPFSESAHPDSARLIGRPFEFGGSWFIPLSNNTLAEFNVSESKFVKTIKAPEDKSFGTVCLFSDKVFSQNYDRLDCFDVKQFVENQLQNKTGDTVRTLLASGYIAWEKDDIETAAAKFRLAADQAPQSCLPILRALAVYALKKDYRRYEPLLDTFQPAFANEQGRMVLAQFKIESCLLENDIQESLATLRAVMDDALKSNSKSCAIDLMNDNLCIERNVWVGAILEKIYKSASEEQKRSIEQWAAKRLEAPTDERSADWLTRQLDFFRVLPIASELRKELYKKYVSSNSLVQAELVLRQLRAEPGLKSEQIAASWSQQAMLIQKSAPVDSAKIFKLINRLYPDVPCCENKTADAYVKSLGEDSPVYKEYMFNHQWPQNEINLSFSKDVRTPIQSSTDNKKRFFNENVFLDGSTFRRSASSQQNLICYDQFGQNKMTLSPDKVALQGRIVYSSYSRTELHAEAPWYTAEHLFFLSERNGQMSAINFLANPGVLWFRDYDQESLGDEEQNPYILIRKANQPGAKTTDANKLCNVYGNIVLIQMNDGSYAGLDAATGRLRWRRKINKDESFIFVDNESFYTAKNIALDKDGNVFGTIQEVSGERYSIYTGFHESSIRLPLSRLSVTSQGVICNETIIDQATQKQIGKIKLCSIKEQKVLWEVESDLTSNPVYLNDLKVLYRFNNLNGRVQILDSETGRVIVDDVFEVMTQEERNKVVENVKALKKRIEEEREEERKKSAEAEKAKLEKQNEKDKPEKQDKPEKRNEGKTEDLLPEKYSENKADDFFNMAKDFFDGIDILSDGSPNGDFYLIVRSDFGYTRKQRSSCKQFSSMRGMHLAKAKIYKYSRDGKALWKEPLKINDQYFCYDIPSGSPFLVFGCNRSNRDGAATRNDYEFMFVDKTTARIWTYKGKNPVGAFQMFCNPEKQTVDILISNREIIVLSFTNAPIPADAPMEIPLLTDEEKAKQKKENEALEKEKEAVGKDDPFDE